MVDDLGLPEGLRLTFEAEPSLETRRTIGAVIDEFNTRSFPLEVERFALLVHDRAQVLSAAMSGVLYWGWLFVGGLWVGDALRGQGIGRALMARAENHALSKGCHSVWLDTFQARGFYARLGYEAFGVLEDYPPGQSRCFMRKRLGLGEIIP